MVSMYELIMDLPLFKGISREQVSMLLEKNRVVFERFRGDEIIVTPGEPCREIRFIVRGSIRSTMVSKEGISVSQTLTTGTVIGADGLYGINPEYVAEMRAVKPVSLLRFSKEEYFRLLSNDSIYLMNYLNYLARGLQMSRNAICNFSSQGVRGLIGAWLTSMTDTYGRDICIDYQEELFARVCGVSVSELQAQLTALSKEGLIKVTSGRITDIHRRELIDSLSGDNEER